ncbi:hypothetical protein M8C21_005931, partial [Ambrosia artemisiifolia]
KSHKPKVKPPLSHTLSPKSTLLWRLTFHPSSPLQHATLFPHKTLMMDDDEWDLQAVVRSCNTMSTDATTAACGTNTTITIDDYDDEFDVMGSVPCSNAMDMFGHSTCVENAWEGLEEVYKEGCSQRLTVAASTTTAHVSLGDEPLHHEMLNGGDSTSTETPSRKRKNQQKKVVVELTQEELCSDTWAWRKYGQKPIKGSPFPSVAQRKLVGQGNK